MDEPLFDMLPSFDAGFMDQLGDTFDTPNGSSSSDTDTLMDEQTKPAAAASSATSAKRIRKGRKQELDELRAVETTLQGRLSRIKAKLESREKRSSNRFWENVAQRMLIEKKLAIRENQRLRALVREQVKAVKTLETSFTKSSSLSVRVCPWLLRCAYRLLIHALRQYSDIAPPETARGLLPDATEDVYTMLFQRIESSYEAIQHKINSKPATTAGDGKRHVTMDLQRDDTGGTLIRIHLEEAKTVPLGFSFLGNRAWYYLSQLQEHELEQGFHRVRSLLSHTVAPLRMPSERCVYRCSSARARTSSVHVNCTALQSSRPCVDMSPCASSSKPTASCSCGKLPACRRVNSSRSKRAGGALRLFGCCGLFGFICIGLSLRVVFEPCPEDPANTTLCRVGVQSPQLLTSADSVEPHARDIGSITELVLGVYEKTVGCVTESLLSSLLGDMHL